MIPFEKYEATGNDFIMLDFFEFAWIDLDNRKLIKELCDRHFGIGADGLIALCPDTDSDFKMVYFNSDGRKSSFCGNGSRASLKYMHAKHAKAAFGFTAEDGPHIGRIQNALVSVKMRDILAYESVKQGVVIQSGSPHLIVEVPDPWTYPVNEKGRLLRHEFDPDGVNVNFIHRHADQLRIATYERGVEWETLACGTGVTAAAYYSAIQDGIDGERTISVQAKGGSLTVRMKLDGNFATEVWLDGPARKVFSGFYELS